MKAAVASIPSSAKDFQIGNLLYCITEKGVKVGEISQISKTTIGHIIYVLIDGCEFGGLFESLCTEPIPITEEFLVKNGFKHLYDELCEYNFYIRRIGECQVDIQLENSNRGGDYVVCHIDNSDMCTIASADIKYVHQLQNLLNLVNISGEFEA